MLGLFCDQKKKKDKKKDLEIRHSLLKNCMKILRKLKISELTAIEEEKRLELRKCVVWLKKKTAHVCDEGKDICSGPEISFDIFYSNMLFFALIYPEELDTLQELKAVYEGLASFYETD